MTYPLIVLGGGMSGLAAAIRFARFGQKTLILEKHTRPGGLNSFYYRKGMLFETGLHAMTNFANPSERQAPLNRLFRQLKLSRKKFITHQQIGSKIQFPNYTLSFDNNFSRLKNEICEKFPDSRVGFLEVEKIVRQYNAFKSRPWQSTRKFLSKYIKDQLLIEMLLCPLMIYGNSQQHDMDFGQFVIMFQAVFFEGFFRPHGTIKDFLNMLLEHYQQLGGEIRYKSEVASLNHDGDKIRSVKLTSGEEIECENVLSTIGVPVTMGLTNDCIKGEPDDYVGKMSFIESIHIVPQKILRNLRVQETCIFYSLEDQFNYCRPDKAVDVATGVINIPANFQELPAETNELAQIRVTHPANYKIWLEADNEKLPGTKRSLQYTKLKDDWQKKSLAVISKIVGNFTENIVYQDTFTPLTIEKYSNKKEGAVYGSPAKIMDGRTKYSNLHIAGTDQGFLGIIGAMLSGVTIVNANILLGD